MQKVFPVRYPHTRRLYVIIPHFPRPALSLLVHLPDERVDVVFPVAQVTTLDEVLELPRVEAARRVAELKWPQKVRRLFEVGPAHM